MSHTPRTPGTDAPTDVGPSAAPAERPRAADGAPEGIGATGPDDATAAERAATGDPGTPGTPGAGDRAGRPALHHDAGPGPVHHPSPVQPAGPGRRGRRGWIVAVVLLSLLALALGGSTAYLYQTTVAWQERSDQYLEAGRELGRELASTRADLAGTEAELAAVRTQLATAQGRIVELADEKARLGDDREVQRQLVDYQQRVSAAAGQVALALDQCVQGQQQLIGYLQNTVDGTAQYDPDALEQFRVDVEALCQTATEANIALQRELSR